MAGGTSTGGGVGASGSATNDGQLEEREDLSKETQEKIEQAQSLIASSTSNLKEALALLSALEKRCRVGNDTPSLKQTCEASLELCHQVQDDVALRSTIETLCSRRSQKTQAVSAIVQKALPWCMDETETYAPLKVSTDSEKEARDKLVECLRDITDGKIFLEAERARLTRALATIKEQDGDIAQAANVLQDVHVETYGSLSKREKIEFILEQMRLTLAKQDYVRAAIVAGKVNQKFLQEESMQDYKVLYFTLMTQYHRHDKNALELAKDYYAIYKTPNIQQNVTEWKTALEASILFLALAEHSLDQQQMLLEIQSDSNLEKTAIGKSLIESLLTQEIVNWPVPHLQDIQSWTVYNQDDLTEHWSTMFHRRIIQHNVRVVAKYYTRITGTRLAQLLQLSPSELETEIAAMVSAGMLQAKMNRPQDIVRFDKKKTSEEVLTDWATDIDTLLNLVESTTHLIHKENMTQ
mmetsp:Transcript_26082/g.36775  ORF Transcript_26082/g.36775 Transcript_26082/m.36775 type:complete len:467 (+) Transcript_26082:200-1600(+)